jgi:MarR family transcriptional regulator, transcriptional regulator for hemolysin
LKKLPASFSSREFLIHDISRISRRVFDNYFKKNGVTHAQFYVLTNLARYSPNEGIVQSELARHMNFGKVPLGHLIDKLEAKGLVKRTLTPQNRRIKRVIITKKGTEILVTIEGLLPNLNRKLMHGITSKEKYIFDIALNKIKNNLISLSSEED